MTLDKVCIVTPPKCGSTSLHKAMCPPGLWHEGPQIDGVDAKHTHVLPTRVRDNLDKYDVYILGRHPYTRLLSLYGHWKKWWVETGDLQHFIERVMIPYHDVLLASSLSVWVAAFIRKYPDVKWKPIQIEKLDSVPFKIPKEPEHLNRSDHGTCEEEYNQDLLIFAQHWGRYDFQLFGYNKEPWWHVRK